MHVVVPFDARRPKTRLAPALDAPERRAFAGAMLRDVLAAVRGAGADPLVLSTAPVEAPAPVVVDDRPLTPAVDDALVAAVGDADDPDRPGHPGPDAGREVRPGERWAGTGLPGAGAVAVVMADLALSTPAAVGRLLDADADADTDADVVLVPGRGGGTNALLARHPGFRVDYHGVSYRDHRRRAADAGAEVGTVDSYRLSTDVDDPGDLPEVLLHGGERSRSWLRDRGFGIERTDGRVAATRDGD